MPFEAYKIYEEYEGNKYKTSTQKKVEKALAEAKKEGIMPKKEVLEFQEAKEIFGKDFLGPESIEKTFGVELTPEELKEVENIPFSKEELEQAKKLGMMLVLRVPHDKDNKPLTIKRMREMFKKDTLGDPKKKKSEVFYDQDWYDEEDFATKATAPLGWGLVMKSTLPESKDKNWDEQEKVLAGWAKKNNLDPKTIRRRTPVEIAHDTLAYYGENKESLLEKEWDWTGVQSSGGYFVGVGRFDSRGLYVNYDHRESSFSYLGVCPAR